MHGRRIDRLIWRSLAAFSLLYLAGCTAQPASLDQDVDGVWVAPDGEVIYRVAEGDTLSEIAAKINVPLETLTALNRLEGPGLIHSGQDLVLGQVDPDRAAQTAAPQPGLPQDGLQIDRVEVEMLGAGYVPAIQVGIHGTFLNSCVDIVKEENTITQQQDGNIFYLVIQPTWQPGEDCQPEERPFFRGVGLIYDYLPPREYFVDVHGTRAVFSLDKAVGMKEGLQDGLANAVEIELRARYGVDSERVNVEAVVWADSCLELPGEGEMCTPGEQPGFRIAAAAGERTWVYHANGDGSELRGYETADQSPLWRSFPVVVDPDQEWVIVRSGPGTEHPVVGEVAGGTMVEVLEVSPDGDWLYIVLPGGTTERAWIYQELTSEVLERSWEVGESRAGVALPTEPAELKLPVALLPDTFDETLSPAWSPDGRQLVFVHEDLGETAQRDIYVLQLEDNSLTRLTDSAANDVLPQWSPDGSQILFTYQYKNLALGGSLSADLFQISPDGSGLWQLTAGPGYNWGGEWSPDGREIVFLSDRSGAEELYLLNADGSGLRQLTRDLGVTGNQQWSPEGTALVFTAAPTAGTTPAIHVVRRDGTYEGLLTHGHSPRWSPDGARLLYQRNENLYVLDVATRQEVQLTNDPAAEAGAVWAPDGSQIAFHANWSGDFDLFLIKADGTGLRWLAHPGQDDLFPRWSPADQALVFYSTIPHVGPGSLLIVGLNGFVPWGD